MQHRAWATAVTVILIAVSVSAQTGAEVAADLFFSTSCPHCKAAKPFVEGLEGEYDWLTVRYLEVSQEGNSELFSKANSDCGVLTPAVPSFRVCGTLLVGFQDNATTGARMRSLVLDCRERTLRGDIPAGCSYESAANTTIILPVIGQLDSSSMSLPLFTIALAGLDSLNPCAFFVLCFLLSLMVHARSRGRMFLVGAVFVAFSGLIYFLFMAAWLNLFLFLGELRIVTMVAGFVALFIGLVNVKDFFAFGRGISLTLPESAKPRLFSSMRALVGASAFSSILVGSAVLAVAANSYELLCTAGFPMVFTRVLTMNGLSVLDYYLYLALYNIVYVLPLFCIVSFFTMTLGSRKMSQEEGRTLKMMSGLMMTSLGLMLVLAPELLTSPGFAVGILILCAAVAVMVRPLLKGD